MGTILAPAVGQKLKCFKNFADDRPLTVLDENSNKNAPFATNNEYSDSFCSAPFLITDRRLIPDGPASGHWEGGCFCSWPALSATKRRLSERSCNSRRSDLMPKNYTRFHTGKWPLRFSRQQGSSVKDDPRRRQGRIAVAIFLGGEFHQIKTAKLCSGRHAVQHVNDVPI